MADEQVPAKRTLKQRLMETLTKDYVYDVKKPEYLDGETVRRISRSANPRKDAEIELAIGEGAPRIGKKKGGLIRGHGKECRGKTKGRMR